MEGRIEKDTLGEVVVPAEALYGPQTARAVANFPISGWPMPASFLEQLALVKKAYALAHGELGKLPAAWAEAIARAAEEVRAGKLWEHFPVDVMQTGSATSTNMNMNEVLARLANRFLGEPTNPIHPNDHVNLGQSSNDVIPGAARLACLELGKRTLLPRVGEVASALEELATRFARTVTLGRTHLVDAVPTTYGRIFDAWRRRLLAATSRLEGDLASLQQLPLGGTAVGSGLGGDEAASRRAVALLRQWTGFPLELTPNPAVGIAAWEDLLAVAESLAHLSRVLFAVANDLRLRASGPEGGLGELLLPAVQPGSSLMPGKVNPVIPEAVAQACLEVQGLAAACSASQALAQLDLFHAAPLVIWNLDTMTRLLANACGVLGSRCLRGLGVDEARCRALAARSPALATALARSVGYEKAAEVVRHARARGVPLEQAGRELGVAEEALAELTQLDELAGL
jgi:fumarate hydratase class II